MPNQLFDHRENVDVPYTPVFVLYLNVDGLNPDKRATLVTGMQDHLRAERPGNYPSYLVLPVSHHPTRAEVIGLIGGLPQGFLAPQYVLRALSERLKEFEAAEQAKAELSSKPQKGK